MRARDDVRDAILSEGYDAGRGTFLQAFGEPTLDAAVLRLPMMGFVDYDDERMVETVDVLSEALDDGGLLRRYDAGRRTARARGHVSRMHALARRVLGTPGAARAGARDLRPRHRTASGLGLFAEEYDPATGRMLGTSRRR